MGPVDDLVLSYATMPEGTQLSGQLCPKCNGGSSNERTMGVGRSGGYLWWKCHRASCTFKGKVYLRNGRPVHNEPMPNGATSQRRFTRTYIPAELKMKLAKKYHLESETFDRAGWSYTHDYGGLGPRVIFPILTPSGHLRGEQFRSYTGQEPKAITSPNPARRDDEMISWYRFRKYNQALIIVEDIPSAVRAADAGVDAVALLGTTLNMERVNEIRAEKHKVVFLCLDNDATSTAVKAAIKFQPWLPKLRVFQLEADVKDMKPEEFKHFIQEVKAEQK